MDISKRSKTSRYIAIVSFFVVAIALVLYAYFLFFKQGNRTICSKDRVLHSPGQVSYVIYHYDEEGKYLGRDSVLGANKTHINKK